MVECQPVKIATRVCELRLAYPWKIAGGRGSATQRTILVELSDADGPAAIGEAAPSILFGESVDNVLPFLARLDPALLSFGDVAGSMARLAEIPGLPCAARCAVNLALLDGAAKRAAQPLHDFLGLGFRERQHVTSFSIGVDVPDMIRRKVLAAAPYPVLKLKLGDPRDRESLAALRAAAPDKSLRVDANEGWKTKEEALRKIEWLAADGRVQFVEQPLPRQATVDDFHWLKERSPLPIFGDENCHTVKDIPRCAECFHGVNVKLVKAGGVSMARETLIAARQAGLKTMIGCLVETSIEISAAAHLAELADFMDIDGNLLVTNDPFAGVTAHGGVLSFATAPEPYGLRVAPRQLEPQRTRATNHR